MVQIIYYNNYLISIAEGSWGSLKKQKPHIIYLKIEKKKVMGEVLKQSSMQKQQDR